MDGSAEPAPALQVRAQTLLDQYPWYWNGSRVVFAMGTPVDGELSRACTTIVTQHSDTNALHINVPVSIQPASMMGSTI